MNFVKKNIVYLILLGIIAAFVVIKPLREFVSSQFGMTATVDKVVAESSFSDADVDIELKGINVPDANLKDFKGQVIFLNFWGTWCPPCRKEWPSIEALHKDKSERIKFVLIAMQDKEEDVKKFLSENSYSAPVYIAQSPLTPKMLPNVFPSTFIVGKNLQILKKEENVADWNSNENRNFVDNVTQ